jgi:probable F420-dependent oxidoreductase
VSRSWVNDLSDKLHAHCISPRPGNRGQETRPAAAAVAHNEPMELDAAIGFDTELADVPALAERAEQLGFGALWTSETRHDPFLPLALVAERTSSLRFGTSVAVAFARSPTSMAMTAWDLAHRSGGRFILGLGTQVRAHVERRFAMPWSGHPVEQLRDYVAAVRAVWRGWQTGEAVRHRGSSYRVTLMTPFFSPAPLAQQHIPIHLAGVGPSMCALAGEVGDGLMVHPLHTQRYLTEVVLPAIAVGAARVGRDPSQIHLTASVLVAIGEEGLDGLREQIAFYASTPSYRAVLRLHGWEAEGAQLSELARRGRWREMPRVVTDNMIDAFGVMGSWADLPGRLDSRYRGVVDRLALYRAFGASEDDHGWAILTTAFRRQRDLGVLGGSAGS